ncbi:hypothetical protein EV360DRAFT_50115, partial [Lentinula raphanica]
LIVGDYFSKSNADDLKFTDKATDLITWLRSKTLILAHLQGKTVIRAVLTRWTAHYQAFTRLLELRTKLHWLVIQDEEQSDEKQRIMKTGPAAAQRKATEMMAIIKKEEFWEALKRIIDHLEPLAIAANIIQAAHCHLDQVLVTFGYLFLQYSNMNVTDRRGCEAIMASIESRWLKSDQELFVAAVLLNPVYRNLPFAEIPVFNLAGIQELLMRLWKRFFPDEQFDFQFLNHLDDYFHNRGFFAPLPSRTKLELQNAMTNVSCSNLSMSILLNIDT